VIEELAALAQRRLVRPELFFWRTQAGAEVDLLIAEGRRILPIEVKLGTALGHHALAGLRQCMKDLGLRRGLIVSSASERRSLGHGIDLVPWTDVVAGRADLF
jgi:predicted AAA+ superfamily ATPase